MLVHHINDILTITLRNVKPEISISDPKNEEFYTKIVDFLIFSCRFLLTPPIRVFRMHLYGIRNVFLDLNVY